VSDMSLTRATARSLTGWRARRFSPGVWLLLWLAASVACADPIARDRIPEPLRPWVPWVLQGDEQAGCPQSYGDHAWRSCVFPSRLVLDLGRTGGTFALTVGVSATRSFAVLPGDEERWPRDVRVDGAAAPVTARDGRPGVWLAPGTHAVAGGFSWQELPPVLPIPPNAGVVSLRVDGAERAARPDDAGALEIAGGDRAAKDEDGQTLHILRLVDDDVPLGLVTRIELSVSGSAREVAIPFALPEGFVAREIVSELPARLDADGTLHVQAHAGSFTLQVTGRSRAAVTSLALPRGAQAEETWSFLAHNDLRLARIEGVAAIDPKQQPMPEEWRAYPAFRLHPGDTLRIVETRRGDPQPAPDKLTLARRVWLDFDGGGYTLQDSVGGTVSRSSRLEMVSGVALGSATLDGQPQLVTRVAPDGPAGLEVHRGTMALEAVSRIESNVTVLPATGWLADFDSAALDLHLPPGWRLVHASGVDDAASSWLSRWTLWDFFFVLLATLAAGRLHGIAVGAAVGTALALSWHLPGAPQHGWIALLAMDAVRRAAPAGRLARWATIAKAMVAVGLAATLVPFAIGQVRMALYPSLERGAGAVAREMSGDGSPAPAAAPAPAPMARMKAQERAAADMATNEAARSEMRVQGNVLSSSGAPPRASAPVPARQAPAVDVDPGAKVQTGSGVPAWTWQSHRLAWHGPVQHDQRIGLFLLSPWQTRIVAFATLALLAWSLLALSRVSRAAAPPSGAGGSGRASGRGGSGQQGDPVTAGNADASRRTGSATVAMVVAAMSAAGLGVSAIDRAYAASPMPVTSSPAPVAGASGAADETADGPRPEASAWSGLLDELRRRLLAPPDCAPACVEVGRMRVSADASRVQLKLDVHAQTGTLVPLPGDRLRWRPTLVVLDGHPAALVRGPEGGLWIDVPAGVHGVDLEAPVADADTVQIALPISPRVLETQVSGWRVGGVDARGVAGSALTLTRSEPHTPSAQRDDPNALPPFVVVERHYSLGLQWSANTIVRRAAPSRAPVDVRVALVQGESVNNPAIRVSGGYADISLGAEDEVAFASTIAPAPRIDLVASPGANQIETWTVDASTVWHLTTDGLAPIQSPPEFGRLRQWRPWPGETVRLSISRPAGTAGQTVTLDSATLDVSPGARATDTRAALVLRSSLGGDHAIVLPEGASLQGARIDGAAQPLRAAAGKVVIPLRPGTQRVELDLRESRGLALHFETPALQVGTTGVNGTVNLHLPTDRVVLLAGGPTLGPAVLFWGVLVVLAVGAYALARLRLAPLGASSWFLLALGMMQSSVWGGVLVVGWFAAMAARKRAGGRLDGLAFDAMQIALGVLTFVAISAVVDALHGGLLGYPDLMIRGNGSTSEVLRWYQDRIAGPVPRAWVVTAPLWWYHLAMLAWALWLAASALSWIKWAWACFSDGRLWAEAAPGGDAPWRRARKAGAPPAASTAGAASPGTTGGTPSAVPPEGTPPGGPSAQGQPPGDSRPHEPGPGGPATPGAPAP
jgi:hypothetical protein